MKKILKYLFYTVLLVFLVIAGGATYLKVALPNVGDAPDLKVERTPERIERGRYLANSVAVCIDCHSTRDWSKFGGPIVAGTLGAGGEKFDPLMGFPGTFYAPNITPHNLGEWTDGEIFRAVTTGVRKDGSAIFPIMPYHAYGNIDTEDIYSIIAYVRTLSPITSKHPEPVADFPVNFLINTMPKAAVFSAKPDTSDQIAYGGYLIKTAGCVDCHSKREKGALVAGTEFGGGMEFKQPGGSIISPNITPDPKFGIGSWDEPSFVRRFKSYADSSYSAPTLQANELNSPMPWHMYAGIKESDLKAMFAYLKSITPLKNEVQRVTLHTN